MIPAAIVIGFIVWISLQTRPSRSYIWEARFQRVGLLLAPIVKNVIADVRAVRHNIRAWRFQRKLNRRWHL